MDTQNLLASYLQDETNIVKFTTAQRLQFLLDHFQNGVISRFEFVSRLHQQRNFVSGLGNQHPLAMKKEISSLCDNLIKETA